MSGQAMRMISEAQYSDLRAAAAVRDRLLEEIDVAAAKAWDSLGKYKFQMFGYWAAIWVHLNRIAGEGRPNPWGWLVKYARGVLASGERDAA